MAPVAPVRFRVAAFFVFVCAECKILRRVGLLGRAFASIAQLAEHALSKRKVTSSILVGGLVIRYGVVGNISACHADARGSIPRFGVFFFRSSHP